jgi:hypothetical protein
MSIVEKIDTERHRRDIYLCKPVVQPSTAGFSPAEPEGMKPNLSTFLKDSTTESAIPPSSVTPIARPISLIGDETPPVSKSTQP